MVREIRLNPGQRGQVTWQKNNKKGAAPIRASEFDGKKVTKIILPDYGIGFEAKPGESWYVEVVRDTNPRAKKKGSFQVRLLKRVFTLDLGSEYWIDQDIASEIAQDVQVRANVMLVGPQGCGKTTLAKAIAESLGYKFRDISAAGNKRRSDWYASRDIKADGSGGQKLIWIKKPLAKALMEASMTPETPFLIFIDELNRASMDACNALLTVIYGEERFVDFPWGERVEVGKNILFMAAINEGSEFGGIQGMDAAFGDRWARHKIGYPPETSEIKMLQAREPAASRGDLEKVVKIANLLREAASKGDISLQISMRMTQTCARRLSHGSSLRRAVISGIINQFQGDHSDSASDAGVVWQKIVGRYGLN